MTTVFINGKFTAQRLTGVQRYAGQIVNALDALAGEAGAARTVLLCPPTGRSPSLLHIEVLIVGAAGLPLHAWEQLVLPWAARSGLLLNLAGSAPLWAARQWCTFHDAAVFDHPASYTWLFRAWYQRHFRWLARRAERLLTVSAHSRGRLAQRLRVEPERIAIVPNGGDHFDAVQADGSVLTRLGLAKEGFLLVVGSRNPTKNIAALMQAWAVLSDRGDLQLVLVGGDDTAVFATTSNTAAAAQIVHAGGVNDAQLKALYLNALALVFPSLDEGFGLPPLEAMGLGCPVAVAQAGAMPEFCGDAVLYFDPKSCASITAAMTRLKDDAALRLRLQQLGPRRASEWTWRKAARTLQTLLAQAGAAAPGACP